MRAGKGLLAAAAAVLLAGGTASADVIDDFDNVGASIVVTDAAANATEVTANGGAPNGVLFTNSEIFANLESGASVSTTIFDQGGGDGALALNEGSSEGLVGIRFETGGPFDFSGFGSLTFEVELFEADPLDMQVTIVDPNGNSVLTENVSGLGPVSFDLTGIASNLLDGVTGLEITTLNNGVVGDDITIDSIQLLQTIPEPTSLAMWGLIAGVGAVGYRRRRKV